MSKPKEVYINKHQYSFSWCRIYDQYTDKELGHFNCFYQATEFINKNNLAITYVTDHRKQGGQSWGVRARS